MSKSAEVIDLFAGPGGLSEGFAAYESPKGYHPFNIALSVEKEASAHRTLELRAFFRSFDGGVPQAYYDYLQGEIDRDSLFERFPQNSEMAASETLQGPKELGKPSHDEIVLRSIDEALGAAQDATVVIGGPPCQAYSIVGRARARGIRGYRAEDDERHFLYREYLRILARASPEVFVMENVKGILSSKVNGKHIFPRILEDLTHPAKALRRQSGSRYHVYSLVERQLDMGGIVDANYLIESEHYGIPQTRHRVILLGVREDLKKEPSILSRHREQLTVADAIGDLPKIRSALSREDDSALKWQMAISEVAPRVSAHLRRVHLSGKMAIDAARRAELLISCGAQYLESKQTKISNISLRRWFADKRLRGYLNHEARAHMASDLERYLYCACFAKQRRGDSPRSHEFPKSLAPKHKNWNSGDFADRFKVQVANRPASTITSHVAKDGHYFIHYDPVQCRALTVREAARLQTFPDNYFFEGNRTEQFTQVGNAVPPLLSRQIAEIVWRVLE